MLKLIVLIGLLLNITILNAANEQNTFVIYEDAEDGTTANWRVYDNSPSGAKIYNLLEGSNHIIRLKGKKRRNAFIIGNKENRSNAWNDTENNIISWKMKYRQAYSINVRVMTNHGPLNMKYTQINRSKGYRKRGNNKSIHHGLGTFTKNGQWHTITRDLEADIKEFKSDYELIAVNAFIIRGSGRIDDIKLGHDTTENDLTPPVITLNGESSVDVLLHDIYEEEGANATDNIDGNVSVLITGAVDIHNVGTYIIRYAAFDTTGNEAQINRTVNVVEEGDTLNATSHVLKTAYFSKREFEGNVIFSVDTSLTEGNVTLLSSETGRYTYISSLNSEKNYDTFYYTVTDENNASITTRVNIHMEPMKVIMTENGDYNLDFNSNLPIVIIDTGDKNIPSEPKIKGSMTVIGTNNIANRSSLSVLPDYSGYMEIEIRGSSSQGFPKKQYSVDTEKWDKEDDDVSLLGMPEEHKWILYAPYTDKSLMRNYLAYNKTREIDSSKYYAVRTHYVELLKREGDHYRYQGVYILMEKIKRDSNRVDVKKMKSSDDTLPKVSGGYIFKRDRGAIDMAGIDGTSYVFVYPKASKIIGEQSYYMENYLQSFEIALNEDDFADENSTNYYGNFINIDAFIVHMLSREFFKDVDSWVLSEYLHKERSDKLYLSTVWDFNLGMGNSNYHFPEDSTSLWAFESHNGGMSFWIQRLMEDASFRSKVKTKWETLRNSIWSDVNLSTFIENTKNLLDEAAERNFSRWTQVLGKYVWPNRKACTKNGEIIYCDTFDSAVNEDLKTWILNRAHWIDGALEGAI